MTFLIRSPFLLILGALAVAMALYDRTGASVLLTGPLAASGIALCSYEQDIRGQWEALGMVLLLTLLCGLRISHVLGRPEEPPRDIRTEATVLEVRPWGRAFVAVLDTPEGGLIVRLQSASLEEGVRLDVEGVTRPLHPASRPGGFDERRYWRARGVHARLSPSRMEPAPQQSWTFSRLRSGLSRMLTIHMPQLTGAYLRAAWTGQRDRALNDAHRTWGTSHLLAVSGFHVGIVVLCASCLIGRSSARLPVLSALLWGYVLLTGGAPSAMRASLMIQTALLAQALGRPSSPVNSVCLAAVLLLLHSPYLFWDIGWRLSVLAVLTITALHSAGIRGWRAWLLLSPAVALITFPQVAYTFRGVPAVGLLLNLAAPVFFSLAFTLASVAAALYFAGIPLVPKILPLIERSFVLWGLMADGLASLIPWTVGWGAFLSWLGSGMLLFLLCRAARLSGARTFLAVTGGSLAAFLLFL